jgi:DNA repair protein SbcC/Rad50
MIIERIKLKNFKSHQNTQIKFKTGISIIIGENGAGKSSILEAVSFALFKQHSGKKIEHLIKNNEENKNEEMMVELDFVAKGRNYRVYRKKSSSSSKAELKIKEGNTYHTLTYKDNQVTKEIQKILEIDSDLFLNAIYVRQGEISNLIEKSPAEKKQMIGKLLGIDSLEKAWKDMKGILDKYKDQRIRLEGVLESFEDLKDELESKKRNNDQLKTITKDLNCQIEERIIESNLLKEKIEILDKRSLEFEKNTTLLLSKNHFLEQLEKTRKDLDWHLTELKSQEKEITELKPKLSKLKVLKNLEEKIKELKNLTKDKERLTNVLNEIQRFEKILTDNEPYYNDYSLLNNEIGNLKYAKGQFEGNRVLFEQYTTRKSKIEAKMNQSLDKTMNILKKSNQILNTHFNSVEEFKNHLATFKPQLESEIQKTSEYIQDIQKELSNIQVKNQDLKKPIEELERVKDLCPICKSTITSEKRDELINDYQTDIETNILRSRDLKEKLIEIEAQKENLDSHQSKIQSINLSILKEYLKSVEEDNKEIKNINSNLKELQDKIGILEGIEKNIKDKKSQINSIKGKYENYIAAKGSLESLGDIEEHSSNLDEINTSIRDLRKKISALMELAGDSVENLPEEIVYLEGINQKYQRLIGKVSQKESLLQKQKENKNLIHETIKELEEINKKIEDLNYNKEFYERVKQESNLKYEELNQLSGEKQTLIGQMNQLSQSIQELELKVESYTQYQKELISLIDFLKLLNLIRELYGKDGIQKDLRNRSKIQIEQNTLEFFEKFNFEYSDIKLDENYDLTVYGPNGENTLDMMSGGEKIAIALALRLGITRTISKGNLELIMLDEPTIHLDTYRRQELIDILKKMSIIPQMIIVTHDADMEDAADNILRIEKEEGTSFLVES